MNDGKLTRPDQPLFLFHYVDDWFRVCCHSGEQDFTYIGRVEVSSFEVRSHVKFCSLYLRSNILWKLRVIWTGYDSVHNFMASNFRTGEEVFEQVPSPYVTRHALWNRGFRNTVINFNFCPGFWTGQKLFLLCTSRISKSTKVFPITVL